MNDAQVISRVQGHPNIIAVREVYMSGVMKHGATERKVFAVMVLETLRGGELYYHIRQRGKFSEGTARRFFVQLASAL